MYPNVIDFETAMDRTFDRLAEADRARLARALRSAANVGGRERSGVRRRVGELVVRLGEWIGGCEIAAGSQLVGPRTRSGCA
jgi:hypothetical protein